MTSIETLAHARRHVEAHAAIKPLPGSGRWRAWLRAGPGAGRHYGRTRAEAIDAAAVRILRYCEAAQPPVNTSAS